MDCVPTFHDYYVQNIRTENSMESMKSFITMQILQCSKFYDNIFFTKNKPVQFEIECSEF